MSERLETITYPVKDLAAAKSLFGALLGVEPYVDEVYYVGFRAPGHPELGLDPNGHAKGLTGPVPYWRVTDLRASLAELVDAGAEVVQDVQDVGGGKLIASVRDANGNDIGLTQEP
ncbi:VOC family protein [Streptomyces fructofermentans]|uniref:VOC family protein n=1 Tax=Streptomyces fructofermentans TaxID=152141 RepID=UPI0033D5744E